jgi:hypothetical protein
MKIADQWRRWLRGFSCEPEERLAIALTAVDAFEILAADLSTDSEPLQNLVKAASSPHKLIFETGCHLLVHLAATQENCRQAIDAMAKSRSSTARFHAVAYLNTSLPEPLRLSVVNLALSDRSTRVRAKAIEQVEIFGFHQLLHRLEAMIASEQSPDVLRSLALHVPLLRDGFLLKPVPDGSGYTLTVRGPRSLGGPFIPTHRLSDSYLRDTVERLKKGDEPDIPSPGR